MNAQKEPLKLEILRALSGRIQFDSLEDKHFESLEKGYKGEQDWNQHMKCIKIGHIHLLDLLLKVHSTFLQADSLPITERTIYLFEIKNFEGNFIFENDRWYTSSKVEIPNPLNQLKRTELLLKRILQNLGFSQEIESYLIFVNPLFHLYHSPIHQSIIFYPHIPQLLRRINARPSKIYPGLTVKANKLKEEALTTSPFTNLPACEYTSLKKGIKCCCLLILCRKFP
ncbi:nuclease-related domain-containing protein [Metabacillus lacus]|nr:nuclease-related domain-containing protein [Metabacillus lacus]